jgi:CRP-like cAMP-binding protein
MEKVFVEFNKLFAMSEATRKRIEMVTEEIIVEKKEILVRQGRPSPYVYFIEEGLLLITKIEGDKEVLTWVLIEMDFVISIGAFFEQLLAKDTIQAGERAVLKRMRYDQLMEICKADREFEAVVFRLKDRYYDRQNECCSKLRLEPIERYRWLMERHPELLTRLPVETLCKYLAITEARLYGIVKKIRAAARMKAISRK